MNSLHRKKVKHFNNPGDCHMLTFSCFNRKPILLENPRPLLFSRSINAAVTRLGFTLVAFVYMPEHAHLIVWSKEIEARIENLLFAIKRPMSFRIKQVLISTNDPLLSQLTIQERPGKLVFRFWQKGPGYDRNLQDQKSVMTAAEYLHNNPVRRGLCEKPSEWKWSSWKFYHQPDETVDPDLPQILGFPWV
jgi:putative transposase